MDTITATPAELRAEATAHEREAADSFARSDTDGFLSQWASRVNASEARMKADLLEAGGVHDDVALFLNGELASTHQGFGQYGEYWVLNDAAAEAFGKRFYSPSKARDAIARDRRRGFTYGTIVVKAHVEVRGSGNGLAGALTVRPGVYSDVEALRSGDFIIKATDGAFAHLDKG